MVYLKEVVEAEEGEVYDIELEANILEANRRLAEENRELLRKYDVRAIDFMGATGSGKTSLMEKMVQALIGKYRIAALKGDLTTTIDAERIERHGAEAVPITTGKECHLDANLVGKALRRIDLKKIDLLFIENVGNLICPAEFPLGSDQRVVVVSVTEGPYMVIKHPFIFMDATGKEKAREGAPVNVSAAFFNPEGTHVFLLLITGSPEMLEKYEEEVQKITTSIKPGT